MTLPSPTPSHPYSAVERAVRSRITPSTRLPAIVGTTLRRVEAAIKEEQVFASVALGGSTAKGTYLRGDHDIDVFVRFATGSGYSDDELAEHLERVLKRVFRAVERVHGSRDYFHVLRGGFLFEFVPVLDISSWEEARNVTDMSPLHVVYVREKIEQRPWLAGDIRLTKQFCKAAKVYGAESYIGGFSGHVIDLLNIHYGGFHKLLEASSSWGSKVVIDPESTPGADDPLSRLNGAKTLSPLVIVDPVQHDRNSAAALSKDAFDRFRDAAKRYLSAAGKEQRRFFTVLPLNKAEFTKRHPGTAVVAIALSPLPGKKDVSGAKCMKVYEHCVRQLLENGFSIGASAWEFSQKRALILFAFPEGRLPKETVVAGPPVRKTQDVARFRQAHDTTFTQDGRVLAVERRRFRDAKTLLASAIKERYVKERVKGARIV